MTEPSVRPSSTSPLVAPTPAEAREIIAALRLGTVPERGTGQYAVGLEREMGVLRSELQDTAQGGSRVKGVRGGYGSGKTFVVTRLTEEALGQGFVVSRVVLSRDGASLAALDRLYAALVSGLRVQGNQGGALGWLLDRWVGRAEEYAADVQGVPEDDEVAFGSAVRARLQTLLGDFVRERPSFAAAVLAYADAQVRGDYALKSQVLGWLSADGNVTGRNIPGLRGRIEKQDALLYLRLLARMTRDVGRPGLLIVLDELDEMRKLQRDLRERAWANLRDLIDQLGSGVPGVMVVLAGTPDVFGGARGVMELAPLAQRLDDPTLNTAHPNLRGPQLPLPRFGEAELIAVMQRLGVLWSLANGQASRVDSGFAPYLASGWTAQLGDASPRVAIREFIGVLDRAADYPDFDPYGQYEFSPVDLRPEETLAPAADGESF